ncbi:ADP-ribose 1''-phosphate phosphatase [Zopfia rhizophila CBS 207.26]|uniref:ADP-ribose 1''-phosphate phosphatase n=1 Tax=Zopfia rhizophila CBS 207.26 TaxID=1314779 RepID=A0A6A6DS51_9PEZI|nr:ADP-ribose 1''-phosphate phosphatase [Zopfia rhizophila CBS 207.26]
MAETASTNDTPTIAETAPVKSKTLSLTTHTGDIFNAPNGTVLIHACNTQGSWGAGIAAAFQERYPKAYRVYRSYCIDEHDPRTDPVPTGTCLLIPPCETDPKRSKHWIGCLFTSAKYGRAKDKPDVILANTGPAMRDLLEQVREKEDYEEKVSGLRMCKINSARFGVPWPTTVSVLEGIIIEEGWKGDVEVWSID